MLHTAAQGLTAAVWQVAVRQVLKAYSQRTSQAGLGPWLRSTIPMMLLWHLLHTAPTWHTPSTERQGPPSGPWHAAGGRKALPCAN